MLNCSQLPAHEVGPTTLPNPGWSWAWEPGVILPLLAAGWMYGFGVWRLWRQGHPGRGIRRWEAWCYIAGWWTLVAALVSPLHPWGGVLFSAHMTQHELLMLAAAPLLVLGRPWIAFLKALPGNRARQLAMAWTRAGWWRRLWGVASHPFNAWLIHGLTLWAWHAPVLFEAALDHEFIHAGQHASFLFSSLLFWWAVLYLFTTALHSGLLGVIFTLARTVVYPRYTHNDGTLGLSALEDQRLGGLIMWIPAGLVYIVAALVLFANWLRASEESAHRRESAIPDASRKASGN